MYLNSWPHYEACVTLADGVAVHYPLLEKNQFRPDVGDVHKRITRKTKMIVVNSPSNPTGSLMEKRDVEAIAETAKEYDLLVLSDEVYEKIVYDELRHISARAGISALGGNAYMKLCLYMNTHVF